MSLSLSYSFTTYPYVTTPSCHPLILLLLSYPLILPPLSYPLIIPLILPLYISGQSFKCKPVRRRYAFEHGTVPRGETEYLKVVYSARHVTPSMKTCQAGSEHIERIFGISSNALELFLLKRKLMGPCWITIRNPRSLKVRILS